MPPAEGEETDAEKAKKQPPPGDPGAGGAPAAKAAALTAEQFAKFARGELALAEREPAKKRAARLTALAKAVAIAKESFANGPTVPVPPIEEAYKGSGGGVAEDLTTKLDQLTSETPLDSPEQPATGQYAVNPGEVKTAQPSTANAGGIDAPQQAASSQFATNPEVAKTAKAALEAVEKQLGVGEFSWPLDLARKDAPEPVAKAAGGGAPDTWGADPWKPSNR
jgi:hypothetical protein